MLMREHRQAVAGLVAREPGKSLRDALGETDAAIEMGARGHSRGGARESVTGFDARSDARTPWWRAARDVSGFPLGGTV